MANACITNSRRPDVAMQEYHAGAAQLSSYSQAAKAPPCPSLSRPFISVVSCTARVLVALFSLFAKRFPKTVVSPYQSQSQTIMAQLCAPATNKINLFSLDNVDFNPGLWFATFAVTRHLRYRTLINAYGMNNVSDHSPNGFILKYPERYLVRPQRDSRCIRSSCAGESGFPLPNDW